MENDVLLKILPDILREIIGHLPRNFDSHAVIDVIDQKFPTLYSELKYRYADNERTTDAVIAQALARNDKFLKITKTGELQDSININDNATPNHCWRKE